MMKQYFFYDLVKRSFDLIVSAVALIVLIPFFIIIGLAIKIDSPGPIFYRGRRIGRFGKPFDIYKFRTMEEHADKKGSSATARNDPRITRIGRSLRVCKIDELPQFFNVIKGEMSLVGPRPEVEEHTRCYNEREKAILDVLPGITDYSSIRFIDLGELLGDEDANKVFIERYRDEKNRLRLDYVNTRSFSVDIKIIIRTMAGVLFKRR